MSGKKTEQNKSNEWTQKNGRKKKSVIARKIPRRSVSIPLKV